MSDAATDDTLDIDPDLVAFAGVRPYGDQILARRIPPPPAERSILSVVLPDRVAAKQTERSPWAVVFAVGPGVTEDVRVGDTICLAKQWGGYEVDVLGHPFVFVRESHVGLVWRE